MFFLNAVTEVHTFSLSGKLFHNTAHLYLTVWDWNGYGVCSNLEQSGVSNRQLDSTSNMETGSFGNA